ncbi:MAG: potassium-transporting ATPase subunit KdpC [Chloroflexi bacterium]|nr:potassium-transporting ATPase subunit KdpC [Chloroflexota bacterium]
MMRQIKPALTILLTFTVVTGIFYPLLITVLAQVIFPHQANGSLITQNGQVVGSELIGQQFDQPQYFWGRLSATGGAAYNASASGGSNLSALNPALQTEVETRLAALKAADPGNTAPVPVDLVTSSGSGLDPNISVAAVNYQAARVAKARGLSLDQVNTLIQQNTRGRILGFLGEATVNVLELNLVLDKIQ